MERAVICQRTAETISLRTRARKRKNEAHVTEGEQLTNEISEMDVGTVFLHVSPYDESHLETLPFKSSKSRETVFGRELIFLLDFIRLFSSGLTCWTSVFKHP